MCVCVLVSEEVEHPCFCDIFVFSALLKKILEWNHSVDDFVVEHDRSSGRETSSEWYFIHNYHDCTEFAVCMPVLPPCFLSVITLLHPPFSVIFLKNLAQNSCSIRHFTPPVVTSWSLLNVHFYHSKQSLLRTFDLMSCEATVLLALKLSKRHFRYEFKNKNCQFFCFQILKITVIFCTIHSARFLDWELNLGRACS